MPHYRGLKFSLQGTLSPSADLPVEVLYLVLLHLDANQSSVDAVVGWECRIRSVVPGVLLGCRRGLSLVFNVSHMGGSAWLGRSLVTSSSFGQCHPPRASAAEV